MNNAGKLVSHYVYDAFGEVVAGDVSKTRYLYTGREFDSASGLQYNHHRWYDPFTGRWINEDPIGFEGGDVNLTRYVGNDPMGYRDSNGAAKTSVVRFIYKAEGTEQIIKVMTVPYEQAVRMLRRFTERGCPDGVKVLVQVDKSDAAAKQLAEAVSPTEKAVHDTVDRYGHPGHYHPIKGRNSEGKPERGAPHIGNSYTGTAIVVGFLFGTGADSKAAEYGSMFVDTTPAGDMITVTVDGPRLVVAFGDFLSQACSLYGESAISESAETLTNAPSFVDRFSRGDGIDGPLTSGSINRGGRPPVDRVRPWWRFWE